MTRPTETVWAAEQSLEKFVRIVSKFVKRFQNLRMLLLRLNLQNRNKFGLYINLCIFEDLRENFARKGRGQPLKVIGAKNKC